MPTTCAAYGCHSRGVPGCKTRFFRFPSASRDKQRREAWIKATRRQDVNGRPWQPTAYSRLCEKHFVTGSPSFSPRHPDFVPSVFVYNSETKNAAKKVLDASTAEQNEETNSKFSRGGQDSMDSDTSTASCSTNTDRTGIGSSNTDAVGGPEESEVAASLLLLHNAPAASKGQKEPLHASELNTLLTEIASLKKKNQQLEAKCKRLEFRSVSVDTVHPDSFKFYTGLQCKAQFDALYKHIETNAKQMAFWDEKQQAKGRKLSKREELFMVLYRLRTGVCAEEIARIFGISQSALSDIFRTWVNFLDKELYALLRFPKLNEAQRHMLRSFADFPNTRGLLDCTKVKKSSRLTAQRQTSAL